MPIDPHKISVHSAGQTQRHVAMTILIAKLSHRIIGSPRSYMIQYSKINRGPYPADVHTCEGDGCGMPFWPAAACVGWGCCEVICVGAGAGEAEGTGGIWFCCRLAAVEVG